MWHSVENIARNRFLDTGIALATAGKNPEIVEDGMIHTLDVGLFVDLVKRGQGKHTDAIRQRCIRELQRSLQVGV